MGWGATGLVALVGLALFAYPRSGPPGAEAAGAKDAAARGAILFAGACASCHEAGAGMMLEGRPALSAGTALHEPSPDHAIRLILRGIPERPDRPGHYMPPFADDFSDAQVSDLLAYIHGRFGGGPAWPAVLAPAVAKARKASGK
jgi:nicotinate dehydrogenase subunit B